MSKYHAQKCQVDGITFDSRKEAARYQELRLLERAGKIRDLDRQVTFTLIRAQYGEENGKKKLLERACAYRADFVYREPRPSPIDPEWALVVEDVKGVRTEAYKIKRKLMLDRFGIRIREV